jgi:hypothetical protein
MKYKLTDEKIKYYNRTLYRIQALKDFGDVKAGDLGGYVESEKNLSQYDNCWVADEAWVYGNARIFNDARVFGNARVFNDARVYGNALVYGNVLVSNNTWVYGNTQIKDGFVG